MRKFALRHIAEATLITAIALLVLSAAALSAELSTPRLNLSEFAKDAARVESLKKGIRVMRSRKPSDPRSWFFQGAIHGVTADAIAEAQQRDPEVAKVEQQRFWNQCPHNGQAAADFLPWHRAYLYYFERILREAAEDSSLTLPYWDYTGDDRTFPALLADADADPVTREPRNPSTRYGGSSPSSGEYMRSLIALCRQRRRSTRVTSSEQPRLQASPGGRRLRPPYTRPRRTPAPQLHSLCRRWNDR